MINYYFNDFKVKLSLINLWGINFTIGSEVEIRDYLFQKLEEKQSIKFTPIKMRSIFYLFFLPLKKKFYREMSFVYPEGKFIAYCFSMFNKGYSGVKKIFSFELFLDLIEYCFKKKISIIFLGIDNHQKNNLEKNLKTYFGETNILCCINKNMSIYQPEETVSLLNRSHHGLVVVDRGASRIYKSLLKKVNRGVLFFDLDNLKSYQKKIKIRKRTKWDLCKNFLGMFSYGFYLFYPILWIFTIFFWLYMFIISREKFRQKRIFYYV